MLIDTVETIVAKGFLRQLPAAPMRSRTALLLLMQALPILASGCFDASPPNVIRNGHEIVMQGNVEVRDDLIVDDGGILRLENARVIVHGSVNVQGTLLATDSDLIIRPNGLPRILEVNGGSLIASNSNIVDADAILLSSATFTITGGTLIFGRMISTDSLIEMVRTQTESAGATQGTYPGDARHHLQGNSRATIVDSIAAGTFYASDQSTIGFLNTSVNLLALSGAGHQEISYRIHVAARHADGTPANNASIDVFSVATAAVEDTNITGGDGRALLIQVTAHRRDNSLVLHDPHLIRANGIPVAGSVAYQGDSAQTIIIP